MNQLKSRTLQLAAGGAALVVLATVAPHAAHAVATALVQVSNTAANPANTQDVTREASQIVGLIATPEYAGFAIPGSGGALPFYTLPSNDLAAAPQFVGPGNQRLVVTSVEIENFGAAGQAVLLALGTNPPPSELIYEAWSVPANTTVQYTFPKGIVVAAGTKNLGAIVPSASATMTLHGYLTSN